MESEGAAESAANEKTGASDDVTETKAEEAESETKENETAPENVEIQVDEKPANVNSGSRGEGGRTEEGDGDGDGEEPPESREDEALLANTSSAPAAVAAPATDDTRSVPPEVKVVSGKNNQPEEGEGANQAAQNNGTSSQGVTVGGGVCGGGAGRKKSSLEDVWQNVSRIFTPFMFEGERVHSLMIPQFANPDLEVQYRLSYFRAETFRFRAALLYLVVLLLSYLVYLLASPFGSLPSVLVTALFTLLLLLLLLLTLLPVYNSINSHLYHVIFAIIVLVLPLFCLGDIGSETLDSRLFQKSAALPITSLTLMFLVFIILYAITSIPVMLVFTAGCLYSFVFELLYFSLYPKKEKPLPLLNGLNKDELVSPDASPLLLFTRLLLHLCLHVIGLHFSHYYSSRKRELFNKKGRAILANQQIERETVEMKNLIYSVMPKVVAEQLMEKEQASDRPQKVFRDLYVEVLDNVSILFADIVGFTNMSSGKTAEELLDLLNDLYGRFDRLAEETGCEKIATLGDCYYCVSGCPQERPDHAKCAINMGLAMIQAIKQFDQDRQQSVQMRVGVHTGKVICGVVGVKRHKFDILSDDVFIANDMESSGEPSAVHISEYTRMALAENGDEDWFVLKEFKPDEEKSSKLSRKQHKRTYLVSKKFGSDDPQATGQGSPWKKAAAKDSTTAAAPVGGAVSENNEIEMSEKTAPTTAALDGGGPAVSKKEEETPLAPENTQRGTARSTPNEAHVGGGLASGEKAVDEEKKLIESLKANPNSIHIFTDTPINLATLWFKASVESQYKHFFREKIMDEVSHERLKCTAFIYDLLPTATLYCVVVLTLILASVTHQHPLGLTFYVTLAVASLLVLAFLTGHILLVSSQKYRASLGQFLCGWVPCHVVGLSMLLAPIAVLLAFASCSPELTPYFCYISILLWIHFANYPRLSTLLKVLLLLIISVLVIVSTNVADLCCDSLDYKLVRLPSNDTTTSEGGAENTVKVPIPVSVFSGVHPVRVELVLQYVLLSVFVWLLSVDFETMIRANFHADVEERERKENMVTMNENTQTKLINIMPAYVVDHFNHTNTRVYSASRQNVGIIFFFVDFWASYSEDYKSGAEYIRLLNELVSDFDALLDEEQYRFVEKIKTISSTYMAASNLNPAYSDDWSIQLSSLMHFMLQLKQKLIEFCQDIPGQSTYISKGGINYGPVTAGVIGSSKLHFDIWGDAVNVASRMYSTGDSNMLQMTERTKDALLSATSAPHCSPPDWQPDRFVYRKKVFVKGKGDMQTYYYKH